MTLIAPSLLAANHAALADAARDAEQAGADWLHVDVMDGHFVPPLTFGAGVVKDLKTATSLPLDVHLMVTNPAAQVPQFIAAGASRLAVHVECEGAAEAVQSIRAAGIPAGLALNPATSTEALRPYVGQLSHITVMTVVAGAGGQALLPETLPKFAELRAMFGPEVLLVADGGVNATTAAAVRAAGADVLVAGSAVFGAHDMSHVIVRLRQGV
ncbi:MAG: ribulose-phosphate 3-epimerase [Pseudomonadaceae bacterium]|nr:ribulose-phosphate 3-epimerase [Pseudomonadaceae bacterium]